MDLDEYGQPQGLSWDEYFNPSDKIRELYNKKINPVQAYEHTITIWVKKNFTQIRELIESVVKIIDCNVIIDKISLTHRLKMVKLMIYPQCTLTIKEQLEAL